jgi:hypothetical protein
MVNYVKFNQTPMPRIMSLKCTNYKSESAVKIYVLFISLHLVDKDGSPWW